MLVGRLRGRRRPQHVDHPLLHEGEGVAAHGGEQIVALQGGAGGLEEDVPQDVATLGGARRA